jgi:hypothetical protein
MGEVQPKSKEPDPNRRMPGFGTMEAHEGSRIHDDKLGSRWILDVHGNVLFRS